jgi:hypothetical protein
VTIFSAERILEVALREAGSDRWGANGLTQPVSGGVLYAYIGDVISGTFDVRTVGGFTSRESPGLEFVGDEIGIAFRAQPLDPAGGVPGGVEAAARGAATAAGPVRQSP